jgi:hypothetical protein
MIADKCGAVRGMSGRGNGRKPAPSANLLWYEACPSCLCASLRTMPWSSTRQRPCLDRGLGGPHSKSGSSRAEKYLPLLGHPAWLVSISHRLTKFLVQFTNWDQLTLTSAYPCPGNPWSNLWAAAAYRDVAISTPKEWPVAADELLTNVPTESRHSTPCLAIYANDQYLGQNLGHLKDIN